MAAEDGDSKEVSRFVMSPLLKKIELQQKSDEITLVEQEKGFQVATYNWPELSMDGVEASLGNMRGIKC